jgi:hypothetical protein
VSTHLVPLSSEWSLWGWAALRGAGFPASLVLALAAPELARAVDEVLTAEEACARTKDAVLAALRTDRGGGAQETIALLRRARRRVEKGKVPARIDLASIGDPGLAELAHGMEEALGHLEIARAALVPTFDAARSRVASALRSVAGGPRFREAVTWQNHGAVETGLDALLRSAPDGPPRSQTRQHEELVANYLHRYCTKNDTIGFFGPVGWARCSRDPDAIAVRPGGKTLVTCRSVHFEQWSIDALASSLSKDARLRPWIAPRRFGFVRIERGKVRSPLGGEHALTPAEESVLRACTGERTAKDVASVITRGHPELLANDEEVYRVIDALGGKGLVAWTLEFGTRWEPERELRRRLERIAEPGLRLEALARLDELESARGEVAAAAGDAPRLRSALASLEAKFTRLTSQPPTRHAGSTYAARGLVFEDCRREGDVVLGLPIVEELAPALGLVLASARWATSEVARVYRAAFRELHREIAIERGTPLVPLADFWFRTHPLLHGTKRPLDGVGRALRERWAAVLGPHPDPRRVTHVAAALGPRVRDVFAAPAPGWALARHHSPDLMLSAPSVDAIARGDWFAVLGEVHLALHTLDARLFVAQHPSPGELLDGAARDLREPYTLLVPSKDSPRTSTVRGRRVFVPPQAYELETGFDDSDLLRSRVLRLGDLHVESVEKDGEEDLVVRTEDGRITLPLLEVMGHPLSEVVVNLFGVAPAAVHTPRITIDRLVVHRESWRFAASSIGFAVAASELDGLVGARRWARAHDLPRFVFVRSPLETKPIYVDFESPVSVRILAKLVRRAAEHDGASLEIVVTEMLPSLDQTWLPDAANQTYTSELRVVAVDHAPRR